MRIFLLLFIFAIGLGACKSATPKEVKWLDVAAADNVSNKEGKKYFIDMYTEWCGWCKVMDNKTFSQPEVIKFMSENFHSVKFDAEQQAAVTFDGKVFNWTPGGRNGINMFAVELLGQNLSYPSYVILDENKKPINVLVGFMEAPQFLESVKQYAK